ncbi:hypothetical protein M5K25_026352 [Dendrobium thyrsiflorum]|uniref:Uncharacterized protein n=1 Tax=Dendrobium thyrsiflorum TaxID=117978 RepID=A0ABD0TX32_DENTH
MGRELEDIIKISLSKEYRNGIFHFEELWKKTPLVSKGLLLLHRTGEGETDWTTPPYQDGESDWATLPHKERKSDWATLPHQKGKKNSDFSATPSWWKSIGFIIMVPRNNVKHENIKMNASNIIAKVKNKVLELFVAKLIKADSFKGFHHVACDLGLVLGPITVTNNNRLIYWKKPLEGCFKLNTDGAKNNFNAG